VKKYPKISQNTFFKSKLTQRNFFCEKKQLHFLASYTILKLLPIVNTCPIGNYSPCLPVALPATSMGKLKKKYLQARLIKVEVSLIETDVFISAFLKKEIHIDRGLFSAANKFTL
jgi:hypothetical protein